MNGRAEPGADNALPARVVDNLDTGVVVVDDARCILEVNPSAQSLLRISARRAAGRNIDELVSWAAPVLSLLTRAMQDVAQCVRRDVELIRPGGDVELFVADIHVSPMDAGQDIQWLIEVQDVTPRVRMYRDSELLAQNTVARAMGRQLAHEIKNPLGGMRGAAQLLARRFDDPAARRLTGIVIGEVDRLVALVDTMLGPVRPLSKAPANIHRLLAHVLELLRAESGAGVTFVEDYDPSLPNLPVDSDCMIQAMLNLGRNALQAVGEDGQIVLRTRAVNGRVIGPNRYALAALIEVQDNGPGVDESLRDGMFYPLVTGRSDGSGLGLSIAQDLVHRHDGLIQYERNGVTVFSVLLPISAPEPHRD